MIVTLQTGERIHYLDWAAATGDTPATGATPTTSGTPIVLVHGLTRTAWTWLPVGRRLALAHPVVAPDLRGHGASDAPLSGYGL